MARRKKEAAAQAALPIDDDPFAEEAAPAPGIKSDLRVEGVDPVACATADDGAAMTALDEFLGSPQKTPGPKVPAALAGVVEHVFSVDVEAEYRRLLDALELGSKRHDRAACRDALDRVERDTVMASRIHHAALLHLERYELDQRERRAAFRDEARRSLEAEKKAGTRNKMITEGDVEDWCLSAFGDEWRSLAENEATLKGTCKVLGEMVEAFRSRQATVRQLAAGTEKG